MVFEKKILRICELQLLLPCCKMIIFLRPNLSIYDSDQVVKLSKLKSYVKDGYSMKKILSEYMFDHGEQPRLL